MQTVPDIRIFAADAQGDIELRMRALRKLGHPYTDEEIAGAAAALDGKSELDALIAYLQVLGTFLRQEVSR
jgi:cytochrome c oxidase cbb3-type subunit 2